MKTIRLSFNSRDDRDMFIEENWKEVKYHRQWVQKGKYWLEYVPNN